MLLLVIISVASVTNAARILGFFPTPSLSHQIAFRPLTQELARRGHEVIVVTPDPAFPKGDTPVNLTEINVHDAYEIWKKSPLINKFGGRNEIFTQAENIIGTYQNIFEQQLMNEEVRDIIENRNDSFDLLLLEACVRPAWVMSHVIKAPAIFVSSFGGVYNVYDAVGAPDHPLLYLTKVRQKLNNLSYWEKIMEFYNHYYLKISNDNSIGMEDEINRRLFGPDTPSIRELLRNMAMLFLNVHPIWEGNRPMPPNVVFMGGMHQTLEKELPKVIRFHNVNYGLKYMTFMPLINKYIFHI